MIGLSICIPVYNFNCIASVKVLCKQIENLIIKAEVIVVDDASSELLHELSNYKNSYYTYEKLDQNIGRARIRNLLAKKAAYNHMLFIDGDSGIQEHFLENYTSCIKKYSNHVICGGRLHKLFPKTKKALRYNYGVKFEDKKASDRNKNPYNGFMTNNFVVTKNTLNLIPFKEEITNYGHEDTFFGFELEKNKIDILHIDNPVIHLELESNDEFINKTKQAIKNLVYLKNQYPGFGEQIRLIKIANRYKISNTVWFKNISYFLSKIFETLSKKTNSSSSFQLFKIFYFTSINK